MAVAAGGRSFSTNGISTMQKIINEAGKKAIEAFVRENLSGRVSDDTVQSYIGMAESQMKIHGGLPSLEISMCFSLTGEPEYLDLEASEVSYEDAILEDAEELAGVFGGEIRARLEKAGWVRRASESGECRTATVSAPYDGYLFSVTAVSSSLDGKPDFYEVKCLGCEASGGPDATA